LFLEGAEENKKVKTGVAESAEGPLPDGPSGQSYLAA
jgi:hypothetical protein